MGINLGWDDKLNFEWRIWGPSGKPGEPIVIGQNYALMNVKVKPKPDFMVHFNRQPPGCCDVGWTSSPEWMDKFAEAAKSAAKVATLLI